MARRFSRIAAGLLVAAAVVAAVPPVGAADQLFVSVEVQDAPASGCQADNAGPSGSDLRDATDALDDAWHAAAVAAGDTAFQEAVLPTAGSQANPVAITFPFATGSRTATVTAFDQTGYANVASVESDTTSAAEDSVLVAARYADLSIAKAATNTPEAGDDLTYELTVSNVGVSPATGVRITDTPDAPVVAASGAGWACDVGPPVACVLADPLSVGETSSTLVVTVATAADVDSEVTNLASVSSDLPDPDETDNTAAVVVTVVATTTTSTTTTTTTTTTIPASTTTTSTSTTEPVSTTTSTVTASTTSTTGASEVGDASLPRTGLSGPPPAVGVALIALGVALLLGARLWGARVRYRFDESR